jgi:hypothetical protein
MCTVTYLPAAGGFTLTHNRDEAPSRTLYSIERGMAPGKNALLFPRDAKAGGSWMVTASDGKTACLLNGAFERHLRQPPYRRSRGLVLLDFFQLAQPDTFFEHYDLQGIEPFTLLYFFKGDVVEFRWDGERRYYTKLPGNVAHFWCSATLYPAEMQEKRKTVFTNWLSGFVAPKKPAPRAIFKLHLNGSVGDKENDFVMNRQGIVQTISVTQVVARKNFTRMRYVDLLEGNHDERLLSVR